MLKHKIIVLMFVSLLMLSMVSAIELKVIKVEELKEGDIIIDKYGNEIPVTSITTKPSESLTISEYLKQKVNIESLKMESPAAEKKFVGDGNNGAGSITGNVIVSGTNEQTHLNNFNKILNKIKAWWSNW